MEPSDTVKPSHPSSPGWTPPAVDDLDALIPDRYEVLDLLGVGGMAAVYKARQLRLDRLVAIKILPPDSLADGDDFSFSERFEQEARAMGNLSHPGIVGVYDFGETPTGLLYFVMEYIDGSDIVAYLAEHGGQVPEDYARIITAHVLDALAYAHDHGIIHRDIKPANVLINSEGQIKIADFGLAKHSAAPAGSGLTQTNMAMGTPDFVAPEALIAGAPVDHRADLYAVGVMLYQMLTGELPRGRFQLPSRKIPALDARIDPIIDRAMATEPEGRYQSAAEMRAALDELASAPIAKVTPDAPSTAIPVTPRKMMLTGAAASSNQEPEPEEPETAHPRGRTAALLTTTIIATLLVVAAVAIFLTTRSQEKAQMTSKAPDKAGFPVPNQPGISTSIPAQEDPPPTTNTALQVNQTYPEALKVPVPDWLRQAASDGGRLDILTTAGFPPEYDAIVDLGEAVFFDDFVEVYRAPLGWMARRSNGDVWAKTWDAGFRSVKTHGPIPTISVTNSYDSSIVARDGNIHISYDRMVKLPGRQGLTQVIGYHSSRGNTLILLDARGRTLETRNTNPDAIAPPSGFFDNATTISAASRTFFATEPGKPLRSWDTKTGAPMPFDIPVRDIVQIEGGGSEFVALRSNGEVIFHHAMSGKPNPKEAGTPADLGPAIRIHAGTVHLAQRPDGTWASWSSSPDPTRHDELISIVGNLGPALDIETGGIRLPGEESIDYYTLAIIPKNAPTPAPSTTLTKTPESSETPTPTPPLPIVSNRPAGKLHAWGHGPANTPPELGDVASHHDDFVQVTVNKHGWAALRHDGEAFLSAWGMTDGKYTGQPAFIKSFNASSMQRGYHVALRETGSGNLRNLFTGGSQTRADLAHPDAAALLETDGHLTAIDAEGSILVSHGWNKGTDNSPPDDFFLGATSFTASRDYYIAARPGLPVRSWSVRAAAISDFSDDIRDIVAMDASTAQAILLSSSGKVFVRDPSGAPLPSDLAFLEPPADLPPALAVRSGRRMCAAQVDGGYWIAWGESPELAAKVSEIGPALDLDLHYNQDKSEFLIWIESSDPSVFPTLTTSSSSPSSSPFPADVTERLAKIDAQYQAAYDRDIAPGHDKALANLDKNYLAAVKRALTTAAKSGDLDASVKVREEVQRLEAGQPLPPLDLESLPHALKKRRKTYRDTLTTLEADRAEKAKPYEARRDQLYEEYQTELTKAGRLDDALTIKNWREGKPLSKPSTPPPSTPEPTVSTPIPPSTPGDIQPILDWVFRIGGTLTILSDGNKITVTRPSELPSPPFDIIGIHADTRSRGEIVDRDFASITAISTLRTLYLLSQRVKIRSLAPLASQPLLESLILGGGNAKFRDTEMEHLAGLTNLKSVRIQTEKITGEGCIHLTAAKNLEALQFETATKGSLSLAGSEAISGLPSLTELNLRNFFDRGNQDTFAPLGTLPALTELRLSNCMISTKGFSHLASLIHLKSLALSNAEIENAGLAFLAPLSSLTQLELELNTTLSDEGVRHIVTALPKLQNLTGSYGATCTGESFRELAKLEDLKEITWRSKDLRNADYRLLADLPNIQIIRLAHCSITDEGLDAFQKCALLEALYLDETAITDKGLPHLQAIASLSRIYLRQTQVTPAGIAAFKAARPKVNIAH